MPGVAARVAGWDLRRNLPGPFLPGSSDTTPPFPQSPLPLAVDLMLFGNWVDVTRLNTGQAGVYARDGISITRGKRPEGTTVDPTEITLTLNNRDGRFSPRNPTGIYYGQIGRNTQLRVRVGNDVRAVGEVSSWPSRWDLSGSDVWVPVTASGILRRLGQGASPLRSPYVRWILSGARIIPSQPAQGFPVAYWPAEDESGAEQIAEASGGTPMTISGAPTFAANSDIPGSDPIPTVDGSRWNAPIPAYTPAAYNGVVVSYDSVSTVGIVISVPAAGATDGSIVLRVSSTGTAARWDLRYSLAAGGSFTVLVYDAAGTLIDTLGSFTVGEVNGFPLQLEIRFQQDGSDVQLGFNWVNVAGDGAGSGDTLTGRTVGRLSRVQVNPNGTLADVAIGQVTVFGSYVTLSISGDPTDGLSAMLGYAGETAGTRIRRLCEEEGIEYLRVLPSYASTAMGAQQSETLVDLLQGCADADLGILFEPRGFLGLAFIGRATLYDRQPAIALDYPSHQMAGLEPVEDDKLTRNDVTVQRTGGSSARQVLETGTLSVQAPPDGVGRYDEQVTVNVQTDAQLPDQAGWRVHLGTVDEARYPTIVMNLANPAFTTNAALTGQARALDIGQRLDVTNPPAWLPPDDITQGVQGLVEELSQYEQTITANLTPDSPWQVAVYDDTTYRYSSDGSTLAAAVDATATSLSVATPTGPLWTTAGGDVPFDIRMAGERMTVTAIAGAASPQTFTVTRSVNGVTKPQTDGAVLELWQPAIYAL
jgi:hypothetical protein